MTGTKDTSHEPSNAVVRVAVPCPLYKAFDYLPSLDGGSCFFEPGTRVRVPFGRKQVVGVVLSNEASSEIPLAKLKCVSATLDAASLLPRSIVQLAVWAARYYHHPIGEVMQTVLPPLLRQGRAAAQHQIAAWQLTAAGAAIDVSTLKRAPQQASWLAALSVHTNGLSDEQAEQLELSKSALTPLRKKAWIERVYQETLAPIKLQNTQSPPSLTADQQTAVDAIIGATGKFSAWLLAGVTGSGKTEVYLRAIADVLAQGKQALVLVPEIGLTPQLLQRFRERFAVPMAVMHSGLSDRERAQAWLLAKEGTAPIVVGTRSAVFTPLKNPGLIIIDEEHDSSFKQQEGFRYSARDVAAMRAKLENIPIVLGSATPSLETFHNATQGRYQLLRLPSRPGAAIAPAIHLVDVRSQKLHENLSPRLLQKIREHVAAGNQVLLFLNRRGFAPVVMCHSCGWVADCRRCDARLTMHFAERQLRCHHCGWQQGLPDKCPGCGSEELFALGKGTERVDEILRGQFPGVGIARIDRDTTRRKGSLETLLDEAHSGSAQILVGTQMLAKGHHFPNVTLVGILDVDQGLFSVDFRAAERMAQLIVQVAGRSGRAEKPGEVLIQTHHPNHPLLQLLIGRGYDAFAQAALAERQAAALPPFSALALLRADALQAEPPMEFLRTAAELARNFNENADVLGPIPAPMGKRAGRYRAHLLIQANRRQDLHQLLDRWIPALNELPTVRKVRWSIDVDALELY